MARSIRSRLVALGSAAALILGLSAVPAAAAPSTNATQQSGGAAGLVAAVVQLDVTNVNVLNDVLDNAGNIEIVTVKRSLNRVLNRNDVLSDNVITVRNVLTNFLNDPDCSVVAVCDSFQEFLNNNDVTITDVVAIDVLGGGDIRIYTTQ